MVMMEWATATAARCLPSLSFCNVRSSKLSDRRLTAGDRAWITGGLELLEEDNAGYTND
ncbi:hypothetical protein PAECIP111802_07375 [Paenibacillus allorhizosphaerae]|uniref:Uncharacterized protein n=1 Tax=Paenibacillus allorhizosphaerae TaxID=2849866 RepID=A0ABN7TXD0_9BACL|nr:hypothetical protein PAECIP111802_07375 [Paenibacillus allorhizosphaerae]